MPWRGKPLLLDVNRLRPTYFAGSQLGQFLGLATQVEGAPPERKSTHEISPLCVWACQEHGGEGVQGGVFGVFNQCFFPRTT